MEFAIFLFLIFSAPILMAFGVKHATAASGLFYVGIICLCLLVIVSFTGCLLYTSDAADE